MNTDEEAAKGSDAGRAGPPGLDTAKAHQARVYDYLLGGHFV
jgi:hypothetical protein